VAYIVDLNNTAVMPYLRDLDLSREGRVILYNMPHNELGVHGDAYLNDPGRRLAPGSQYFRVDFLFRDAPRRVAHHMQFIVNGASAQYGVLRVVFVEDERSPAG